jgi:adenylyltransferase/sulfurtransferase
MSNTTLFSRSTLAGYDPEKLAAGKVAVVGVGALGQNIAQGLALSGVGNLALIDFDIFEPHNATRSPFYPTTEVAVALGLEKAPTVAHRAAQSATMPGAQVRWAHGLVQHVGNGILDWADVVVSAVDSNTARAWISEQVRAVGKPLIEGGFSGPDFTLASFSGESGRVCYRCASPAKATSASCTLYARRAETSGIIPAIQTTAAVAAGYQTELVIQLLHQQPVDFDVRLYGNLRTHKLDRALLQANPDCPGNHTYLPVIGQISKGVDRIKDLAGALQTIGIDQFALTEPLIVHAACRDCHQACDVVASESSWLGAPFCSNCQGPWQRLASAASASYVHLISVDDLDVVVGAASLIDVGVSEGCSVAVITRDGEAGRVVIGDVAAAFGRMTLATGRLEP